MCDLPVVAGSAGNRDAGECAVLREGGRRGRLHGLEQPDEDAGHGMFALVQVGKTPLRSKGLDAGQNTGCTR